MEKLLLNKPKILADFLFYLVNVKNYSLNTADSYSYDLMLFFRFLKKYHDIQVTIFEFNVFILSNVKEDDIDAFLIYLNLRNNSPSSRKRKIDAIKCFYKWLFFTYKLGISKENPVTNISIIQMYRVPKYLSLEQAKSLLNIFNKKNSKHPLRNNTIISIFLNCGLRLSELRNIKITDVNLINNSLRVIGKGNKERTIYLNNNVSKILKEYIEYRISQNIDSNWLFISNRGERVSSTDIEYICKKAYKLANLENYNFTVHTLRHTAATLMYQYGNVDIRVLQEFLGHESINSTEIYAHIHNKQIKNAVDSNPLNIN